MAGTRTKTISLRERKKLKTRRTIVDVAARLFVERGYHGTTMAEIAEEAELSLSTVFNYFPTKADIVFVVFDEVFESARERIAARPHGESATRALAEWLRHILPFVEPPYPATLGRTPEIIAATSELADEERLRFARLEDTLAGSFADDLGDSPHGVRARVLAAAALTELRDVWHTWWTKHVEDARHLESALAAKADHVIHVLEAMCEAVRDIPTAPA